MEQMDVYIEKIRSIRPDLTVEPAEGKAQLAIDGKTYHFSQVATLIEEFENARMDAVESGEDVQAAVEDTTLANIDDVKDIPTADDFLTEEHKKTIESSIKKLSKAMTSEEGFFKKANSKRLVKGEILFHLENHLKEWGVGNPRKYIRNKVDEFGLEGVGNLTTQEFTWTTKAYEAYFYRWEDDLNVEITHPSVVEPDSDVPKPFAINQISIDKLYLFSSLIESKEDRNEFAAIAQMHNFETCQMFKKVIQARKKKVKETPVEIAEMPNTSPHDILAEVEDINMELKDGLKELLGETREEIKEAKAPDTQSDFVTLKLPRNIVDYLNDPTDESGIKDAIDRHYPMSEETNSKTGIRASTAQIFELVFRLIPMLESMGITLKDNPKLSGRQVIEEALVRMRKQDE